MRSTFSTVWFLYKRYEGGVVIISMLANVWAVGTSAWCKLICAQFITDISILDISRYVSVT